MPQMPPGLTFPLASSSSHALPEFSTPTQPQFQFQYPRQHQQPTQPQQGQPQQPQQQPQFGAAHQTGANGAYVNPAFLASLLSQLQGHAQNNAQQQQQPR